MYLNSGAVALASWNCFQSFSFKYSLHLFLLEKQGLSLFHLSTLFNFMLNIYLDEKRLKNKLLSQHLIYYPKILHWFKHLTIILNLTFELWKLLPLSKLCLVFQYLSMILQKHLRFRLLSHLQTRLHSAPSITDLVLNTCLVSLFHCLHLFSMKWTISLNLQADVMKK